MKTCIRVIKPGTLCRDKATELEGMITHWICNMGLKIDYLFQPKGLNPENGQPVKKIALEAERLEIPEGSFKETDIPFEVLGTQVKDKASGFNGMAVSFIMHTNGCFHVSIQPSGVLPKTNSPINTAEFDLRQCEGEKIPAMAEAELDKSKEERPSPTGDRFDRFPQNEEET